jgi:hypothetical protein
MFLSVLKNLYTIADGCHSKDTAGHWDEKTMITIFFAGLKLIVLDIVPKGSKFGQLYFPDYIFLDLKRENVNFHRRIPQATFGHVWTFQWATINQKWHQKSRNIMLHDYHTYPIHQTSTAATFSFLEY